TAQKRTQNLQDVPIVVTTLNRELLQDTGVRDIKDLTLLTPGLLVTTTSNETSTTARIRGIGTVGDNIGLESSVGVVIDDVYRPRNGVGFGDLGDVDRIEVLKGPQGTLFGKSTSAGVINILTSKPSFDFGGDAEFTVGNYNAYGGSIAVTGPLVKDTVAGSLYFADRQRDGFYNVVTGQGPRTINDDQNHNYFTLRGQILALPNDDASLRLIADYSHRDEHCCVAVVKNQGPPGPIVAALGGSGGGEPQVPNPYDRTAYANQDTDQDVIDWGLSAELNYKLPDIDAEITAITAYREWKTVYGQDPDFTNADILVRHPGDDNSDSFDVFSQELRFAGKWENLDYLVGGFYANEDLHSNYSLQFGNQYDQYLNLLFSNLGGFPPSTGLLKSLFGPNATFAPGAGSLDHYHQTDDTYAIFTNETWHVTDAFDITGGLRFTDDEKNLSQHSSNIGNPGQGCSAINSSPLIGLIPALQQVVDITCLPFESPSFNNFTNHQSSVERDLSGTIKLSYRLNPDLLGYASYARGYKAGGFNLERESCPNMPGCALGSLATSSDTHFPAENADSYEVGIKSTLLDRTLILNATLFLQHYRNFQFNTFNGLVFVVESVPDVYSRGVDADFVWLPTADLSFQGGITVANTKFTDGDQSALNSNGVTFLGEPGSRLPLAPLYSWSLSGTYSHNLFTDLVGRATVGIKYSSSYNTGSDLDPRKEQDAFALVNARVSVGPEDGRYSVELWAENLFDQNYQQVAFDAPFQNAPTNSVGVIDTFLGAPRTFGATFRVKF
ncbi:MAG TPA: TonB-dependent receptor, partial [Alphaproteobacteria bacterium]|nr:TonB-dependent receptor [Alphaproteobacteria bacterium]